MHALYRMQRNRPDLHRSKDNGSGPTNTVTGVQTMQAVSLRRGAARTPAAQTDFLGNARLKPAHGT